VHETQWSTPAWQAAALVDPMPSPPTPAPPAPPASGRPPRIRLRWHPIFVVLGVMLALTVTAVGAGGVLRAPYVVYAPGSAIPTEPAISAPGTETFETEGSVLFLTVSLRGASRRMGYVEAVWGWLKGDQDVYPRDAILGNQTGAENREAAVQEMALSQEVAAKVALEHLGYDVPVDGTGTVISDTIPDTPAADVLRSFDVITELDGVPTPTDLELRTELEAREPGDVVAVTFERDADGDPTTDDADERTEDVELVADPDDPDRTLLGVVQVFTRDLTYELPFPVKIDTEDVGGPSAGLALTLGILDVLTPGSITGGHTIAVTGTIDPTGVVGEVGGVGQKAVAATREGAELLLVPAAEAELAERFAGDDVRIVGVETLDDALAALDGLGGNALDLADSGG
jgi:PDZ domain-containing protein